MIDLSEDVIFVPVYNENKTSFWTNVSGGSATRSGVSPSSYYWAGSSVGNYVENRFVGDVCRIYFGGGSTGSVTITVDGSPIVSGLVITTLPRLGVYYVYDISNLTYDAHTLRITVDTTSVHVIGMLVVKENLPFLQYAVIHNANTINYLSSTTVLASTTTALSANATYSTGWKDLEADGNINWILITVFSNVAGTLYVEFSNDNNNPDAVQTITYNANSTPYIAPIQRVARYVRVRYTNGSTAQSTFRLYVRGVYSTF
jgi:hypothetical protein